VGGERPGREASPLSLRAKTGRKGERKGFSRKGLPFGNKKKWSQEKKRKKESPQRKPEGGDNRTSPVEYEGKSPGREGRTGRKGLGFFSTSAKRTPREKKNVPSLKLTKSRSEFHVSRGSGGGKGTGIANRRNDTWKSSQSLKEKGKSHTTYQRR